MKNLNIRKKAIAMALAGTLTTCTLTGCNATIIDTKLSFNKAIIFGNNTATIIEIMKWSDYDGEQLQLITNDVLTIVTSSFDTKLINDTESTIKAEDVARSIMGDNVTINYLDSTISQNKTK